MTKLYSKLVPGVWFDTIPGAEEADEHGLIPAFIHTPEGEGYTVVHMDTVSFVEIAPVPDSVPDTVFVTLSGDAANPRADVFWTEREAKFGREGAWGYFPVQVVRNSLISI